MVGFSQVSIRWYSCLLQKNLKVNLWTWGWFSKGLSCCKRRKWEYVEFFIQNYCNSLKKKLDFIYCNKEKVYVNITVGQKSNAYSLLNTNYSKIRKLVILYKYSIKLKRLNIRRTCWPEITSLPKVSVFYKTIFSYDFIYSLEIHFFIFFKNADFIVFFSYFHKCKQISKLKSVDFTHQKLLKPSFTSTLTFQERIET